MSVPKMIRLMKLPVIVWTTAAVVAGLVLALTH